MNVLADTNILLRSAEWNHPMGEQARAALKTPRRQGNTICIVPQNIVEFWGVSTRPLNRNGLGFSGVEVQRRVARLEAVFLFLADTSNIHVEWKNLVGKHAVLGSKVHDARLVAAMHVHSIEAILTFNTADFRRYPGVAVLHPDEVLQRM